MTTENQASGRIAELPESRYEAALQLWREWFEGGGRNVPPIPDDTSLMLQWIVGRFRAATRETRGTAPPQPDAHRTLQTIFNELNDPESGESERWVKIEEVLHQYFRAEPVAPPPPIDEERFQRIVKFLSENEAFCQVTPTNGTPWGFGLGEATRTFTLHTCKNGCGFYVKNQGDECLSCSAKWLVEQINKLRAASPGTHPPQGGANETQ